MNFGMVIGAKCWWSKVWLGPPVLFNFKSCNLAPAREEKLSLEFMKIKTTILNFVLLLLPPFASFYVSRVPLLLNRH